MGALARSRSETGRRAPRRGPGAACRPAKGRHERHPVVALVDARGRRSRRPSRRRRRPPGRTAGCTPRPVTAGSRSTMSCQGVAHLAEQPLDEPADDRALDLGERPLRLRRRRPGPPSMWSTQVITAVSGSSSTPSPGIGSAREHRHVRRRAERVDVLGVACAGRSRPAATPAHGAQGGGEHGGRLAGEAVEAASAASASARGRAGSGGGSRTRPARRRTRRRTRAAGAARSGSVTTGLSAQARRS